MAALNWTKLYEKYKGLWVALEKDEETFIAAATTAKEALKQAQEQGKKNPILTRMPDQLVTYVGSC